ncbi:MAG: S8 family serine peptidase [Aulosira sp. DedQUE10]|nr:S8 family serine peptidase [Aulosira sp. DedQUE10]
MRVLIQMRYAPTAIANARSLAATATSLALPGVDIDESYAPVLIPDKQPRTVIGEREVGRLFTFNVRPEVSSYLVRGEVADESALADLTAAVESDPNVLGVYSDPKISTFAVCPPNAVGTHNDVENVLNVAQLRANGMDGSNVLVAIVDTGVNVVHLTRKGKNPNLDTSKSWAPVSGITPGKGDIDHGTMCAFDVAIAAPNYTLLDYALLQSRATGGSVMEGFLSDAVKAFSNLLQMLSQAPDPKPALVVNNSWGMYNPSWDFPVGHPGNYSDNPNHPFNIIVESLEDAGADILFAAGNCGADCPSSQCLGVTNRAIYGANSHPSVLSVAGVTYKKERVGYSSQGPGRLSTEKPDISAYTHFVGSGVYSEDNGTSAACPVAAGVIAAIRTVYSPAELPPAQLRQLVRRTAEDLGGIGFDYSHGFGVINVPGILNALETPEPPQVPELPIGEIVSGHLNENGDTKTYRVQVENQLLLELDGPTEVDFDLYARNGKQPTINEYDYRGYTNSPDERISIQAGLPGEYFVMVRAYRGSGDFQIKASVE